MQINGRKSIISYHMLSEEEINSYRALFPFELKEVDEGIKYLGFNLKPNDYKKMIGCG
jgi:hypothetical protein